jgi:hypothetical protein
MRNASVRACTWIRWIGTATASQCLTLPPFPLRCGTSANSFSGTRAGRPPQNAKSVPWVWCSRRVLGTWLRLLGGEPRTHRVASVHAAKELDSRVRRPKGFQLPEYWAESIQRFERELYKGHALVLATAMGLKGLRNLSRTVARSLTDVPASTRQDGRVEVNIPIESTDHAAGQFLRLAPEVEVLRPIELRRATVSRLKKINRLYNLSGSDGFWQSRQ